MTNETILNGHWELRDEPLWVHGDETGRLAGLREGWISQPVPGDIHQGLIAAGRIKEPLVGLNSFDSVWTEDRSWWFRKKIPTRPEWRRANVVELEVNGLDCHASIWFNGSHLGEHRNAFYPFVARLKEYPYNTISKDLIKTNGDNILLIRLTSGFETISRADLAAIETPTSANIDLSKRGDPRRAFTRKPQFSAGWDWSPRLVTTAIGGDVRIRAFSKACIRDVYIHPVRDGKAVKLQVTVTVDSAHYYRTDESRVRLSVTDPNGRRSISEIRTFLLKAGLNFVSFDIPMRNPRLWWPNGMGKQELYCIHAELVDSNKIVEVREFPFGIRFVELESLKTFAFLINGREIFCKGANWVPADALYTRPTPEIYERLIQEAKQANINMLRVWGGGRYEPDYFYHLCDRYGIMVWQDFMFSGICYPDHSSWFREEIRREAEYQTRRLRNHACVVLLSGNNECFPAKMGTSLYHYLLSDIAYRNCPAIPYWNGSPYGGETSHSETIGDCHYWKINGSKDMETCLSPEAYDQCQSPFVSEFGYIGIPVQKTVTTYMDGAPVDFQSKVWQHHVNTCEEGRVLAGIHRHYADSISLPTNDYFLYSGLCQGMMLGYAMDSFRFRPDCHGGLIWMYNDAWGEMGWSLVDYYLRRKIAWYFVRRSLAPLRLIMRPHGEINIVRLANDTLHNVQGILQYGSVACDGSRESIRETTFACPLLSRTTLVTFPRGQGDPTRKIWFARVQNNSKILPAILRGSTMRRMKLDIPRLEWTLAKQSQESWRIRVKSNIYAHAVHFLLPEKAESDDNYFDLLPGETRTLNITYRGSLSEKNVKLKSVITNA